MPPPKVVVDAAFLKKVEALPVAGWAISVYFFDMAFQLSPSVWIYSLLSASLVLTLAGTLVSRRVYNVSPMKVLRS